MVRGALEQVECRALKRDVRDREADDRVVEGFIGEPPSWSTLSLRRGGCLGWRCAGQCIRYRLLPRRSSATARYQLRVAHFVPGFAAIAMISSQRHGPCLPFAYLLLKAAIPGVFPRSRVPLTSAVPELDVLRRWAIISRSRPRS